MNIRITNRIKCSGGDKNDMDMITSFNDFMLHTKNIIYILMVVVLLAMPAIWSFLNGKDRK
jgi:hypothetical protein